MTAEETSEVTAWLSLAGHMFHQMDAKFINYVTSDQKLSILIKTYNNSKVKKGQPIGNPVQHVNGLIAFIDSKYQAEIDSLKTEKGKDKRRIELQSVIDYIDQNKNSFLAMFEMMNYLVSAKTVLIQKLQSVKSLGTFLETPDGFRVTNPEGFVAIDNISGKAVKLVDRLEFSKANFTLQKNW